MTVATEKKTKPKIYLASPHMSDEGYERRFVKEAFDDNWIAPLGKNVDEFERAFAATIGMKAAAALSSGTAAIHMALKSAGVGEGDTVFCQSFTFSASANPIIYQHAVPVFIDSDEASWNLSPSLLAKAFKKHRPAAVIAVHLYGFAAELDEIVRLCKNYEVPLIEDAAEGLGGSYRGKPLGSFGDYGTFSFNGNKIITTSGGGMLVSDNEEQVQKIRFWSSQARDPARHYQHSELGYNYRLSNICAGIGRGQLLVLKDRLRRKAEIFEYYKRSFASIPEIEMMPMLNDTRPNYWLSCITLRGRIGPADVMRALDEENIESRPLWKPMHLQPYYKDCESFVNGVSERLFESGLCLPSGTNMSDEELERVVHTVTKLF